MPQTGAEIVAKKVEAEVKRLAPQAVTRIDYSSYHDDGADLYIYSPRKISDMLRNRVKTTLDTEMRRTKNIRIRLLMEDIENMSDEAKKKYGIPA